MLQIILFFSVSYQYLVCFGFNVSYFVRLCCSSMCFHIAKSIAGVPMGRPAAHQSHPLTVHHSGSYAFPTSREG